MRFTAFPIAFASLGLGILVLAALGSLNPLAVVLAAASLLAVFARLVLSLRENAGMLVTSRHEALTDALTGLGNRRALTRDLDRVAEGQRAAAVLALFDLDGFKHYNDSYGHPAGDALLQRLGAKLAVHVAGAGTAYRMGGDEFCVLLRRRRLGRAGRRLRRGPHRARRRLHHHAARSARSACRARCSDAGEALRIADQRMYAHKHSGRSSARSQSRDVLLRALAERNPELGEHISGVAELAEAVARRMELDDEQIDHVRHAAALHDVGKMAIPDAILDKPARARRRRVGVHPPPHDHRRAHRRRRAGAAPGRRARALEPRALGRLRLPRRPGRRGHPAGRPHRLGLRRLRRDGRRPPLPRRAWTPRRRPRRARALLGLAVRPRGGGGLRRRLVSRTALRAAACRARPLRSRRGMLAACAPTG